MRFIFLTILCILFANQEILSASDEIGDGQTTENPISTSDRQNTTVFDLNYDCLTLIVQFLDIYHLMQLSSAHEFFNFAAKYNLRHRFAKKSVVFETPFTDGDMLDFRVGWHMEKYHGIREWSDTIQFRHLPIILNFFEHFGDMIQSLEIVHREYSKQNATQMETVWQATNRYCSENLTRLCIVDHNNASFTFDRPFKKLELLKLSGNFKDLSGANMFPSVRELVIGAIKFENADWMDHEFPLLNNLTVFISDREWTKVKNGQEEAEFERFLQNNGNIRNLTLEHAHPQVLEYVANKLQNLDELCLIYYKTYTSRQCNINFPGLKKLVVHGSPFDLIDDITFGSIEELSVFSNGWIESIKKNVGMRDTLRKLWVKQNIDNSEIMEIAKAFLNLTEIYFQPFHYVKLENIVTLIESSDELQKLGIHTLWTNSWETAINVLQRRFAREWIITQSPYYIELERKNEE